MGNPSAHVTWEVLTIFFSYVYYIKGLDLFFLLLSPKEMGTRNSFKEVYDLSLDPRSCLHREIYQHYYQYNLNPPTPPKKATVRMSTVT